MLAATVPPLLPTVAALFQTLLRRRRALLTERLLLNAWCPLNGEGLLWNARCPLFAERLLLNARCLLHATRIDALLLRNALWIAIHLRELRTRANLFRRLTR